MRRVVIALLAAGLVVLEVLVLVLVASWIGWWTVAVLCLTSAVGAWLVKREGAKAWSGLRDAVREGTTTGGSVGDAVIVLAGGVLILVPGFVTDVLGALVVLPFSRPLARRLLVALFGNRIADLENRVPTTQAAPGQQEPGQQETPPSGAVVEGRVVPTDRTGRRDQD